MAYTDITVLSPAPQRSDSPDDFVAKADAFVSGFHTLTLEINAGGGELNAIGNQAVLDYGVIYSNAANTTSDANNTTLDYGYTGEWSVSDEDVLISLGAGGNGVDEYSSKHYALKSKTSAESSKVYETQAASNASLPTLSGGAGKLLFVDDAELSINWEDTDLAVINSNISLNSFNIAVNGGLSVQNMIDGVSDAFVDETGVDTDRSIGQAYSNTGQFYPDGEGFDISSNASYSSENVFTGSQDSAQQGFAFSRDGTKLFTVGDSTNSVYQYNLASAFDLSQSVTYSTNSFSLASQETAPRDITFNNDGTKFFVVGNIGDAVLEYTCSIGYDLSSTVVYSGNSFSVSSQAANPDAIVFNADGTKFFMGKTSTIYEYTCSVGFDLSSTVAYSGNSYSMASQLSALRSISFNRDGTKFLCGDQTTNDVYAYACSVGFDLSSTVAYSGNSFDVGSQSATPRSIKFSSRGDKFFAMHSGGEIYEYHCPNFTTLSDLSLHTQQVTPLTSPKEALVVLHEEDIDSVTLNTDLQTWVTRTPLLTYTTNFAVGNKLNVVSHGFLNGDRVILSTPTGDNFPVGLDGITSYHVVNRTDDDFEVSLTSGGVSVSITADNGGTQNISDYSQAVLSEQTIQPIGRILTGTADLSSQDSGTLISTVIITDNLKSLKIHALSTQWK